MYRVARFIVLVVLVANLAKAACAVDFEEVKLGSLPVAVLSSPDDQQMWTGDLLRQAAKNGFCVEVAACSSGGHGHHLAAVVPLESGKCAVWFDGKTGEEYDQIRGTVRGAYKTREFSFSPDGMRLAYTAREGDEWFMVVDGKPGPKYDGLREPYFSMDSKRCCYVGFEGKSCALVVDGKEIARYPTIQMSFPSLRPNVPVRVTDDSYCPVVFGPNGRFAFAISKGRDKNGKERCALVIDGKPTPEYDATGGVAFSPDGKRVAYVAARSEKYFAVVDGKPGSKFDMVEEPTFSPDSKRVAYATTRYGADSEPIMCVVADGVAGPKFHDVLPASIAFSPDSKHLSYVASRDGERWFVVADGKPGPEFDEIGGYGAQGYGPNGEMIYIGKRGEKHYMVTGTALSPAYDDISERFPVFSPDGKHYAYSARKGERWSVVRDGEWGKECTGIHHDTLQFTGDGRLVYEASTPGGAVAVIHSVEHNNMSRPVFSPDGKHMAFQRNNPDEAFNKIAVVVDGKKIGMYEQILPMHFLPEGDLEFLATRDESTVNKLARNLYRVRVKL